METEAKWENGSMILKKYANTRWVRLINDFLESKCFIALVGFLTLCSNVFGWELFIYTLIVCYGYYLCLFARDMRSLAAVVPFMYVTPSTINNPSANPDSVFYPQHGLFLLIAYLVVFFALLLVRIVLNYKRGERKFFAVKRKLLSGFLVLGAAFALGGVGQPDYTFSNIRYAVILFISLFLFYYCLVALVDWKSVPRDYFAWVGLFFGLLLTAEVLNIYVSFDVVNAKGQIDASKLYTGWGVNNNIGGMLICCIPCAFYLAATKRHGAPFIVIASLIWAATVFTTSRNSILCGTFLFAVSAAFALWNRKNRKENLITYGILFTILCSILIVCYENAKELFYVFVAKGFGDSGRSIIYQSGWEQFLSAPFLGRGFYACDAFMWGGSAQTMTFVPPRWHNTIIQMLAACGGVGILAYGYHRFQTVKLFVTKPSLTKTFIGLSISAILLGSLLDCFLFNIGPCLFYSVGLAYAENEKFMPFGKPLLLGDTALNQKKTADYFLGQAVKTLRH